MLGFFVLVIGVILVLYSKVINVRDSTAKAMGDVFLKTLAGWIGGFMVIIGLIMLLMSCAA